jgi:hypothetical protein
MQTTYSKEQKPGRHGQAYDSSAKHVTRAAEAAMRPGDIALRGVLTTGEGKTARPLVVPTGADDDAIILNVQSSLSLQTLSGAGLTGVIGQGRMVPARQLELVVAANAHWLATSWTLVYENEFGREVSELLVVGAGGNVTVRTAGFVSRVVSLTVPIQGGVAGTAKLGTNSMLGPLTSRDVLGIVAYKSAIMPASTTAEYAQYDVMAVIHEGRVSVEVEEDVKDGEQVFTRLVAGGGEFVGGFRNDRDGTATAPDAVAVIGLRFWGDSVDRDGLKTAVVEFNFAA